MTNEPKSRGGNGRDDGRIGDDTTELAGPDDETVVIVSDSYTRGALSRFADGSRGVAALCDWFVTSGEAASHAERAAVLGELRERLTETKLHNEGALRAVSRLEVEALAKASAERFAKENP